MTREPVSKPQRPDILDGLTHFNEGHRTMHLPVVEMDPRVEFIAPFAEEMHSHNDGGVKVTLAHALTILAFKHPDKAEEIKGHLSKAIEEAKAPWVAGEIQGFLDQIPKKRR